MKNQNRTWQLIKDAISGKEQDYTSGNIDKAILLLSVPMILETMMESLFAVVDAFFVGKIGPGAVAVVGITETVITIIYSMAIGLSAAITAMVSRRIGEGNKDGANRAAAQAILLALVISVLIGIPGWIWAKQGLHIMSNDAEMVESGFAYAQILFGFNLPILLLWMLNGVFRGAGNPAIAMRALWIANIANLILDPCLIFGFGPIPAMGIKGAAIATTIGRSIGVVYQLWELMKGSGQVRLIFSYFKPNPKILTKLIEIASGSTGQYLIASASWIFMIYLIGHLGTDITAGYTFALRIVMFTILPSWGMANAAATLVGQNLGAGKPDRAGRG